MLRGQMLPGQMSSWQLESVVDVPRNLSLKFHQNRVSNSWDIADIEFVWWWWVGCAKSFYGQTQPCVEVRLGFWQLYWISVFLSYQKQYQYKKSTLLAILIHLIKTAKVFIVSKVLKGPKYKISGQVVKVIKESEVLKGPRVKSDIRTDMFKVSFLSCCCSWDLAWLDVTQQWLNHAISNMNICPWSRSGKYHLILNIFPLSRLGKYHVFLNIFSLSSPY